MNILTALVAFFLISSVITIATDVAGYLLQLFVNLIWYPVMIILKRMNIYLTQPPDVQKIKLLIAFIMTAFAILGFNQGIMITLQIPVEATYPWFYTVDIWITIIFLTGGSSGIHKLQEAAVKYQKMIRDLETEQKE